MACAIREAVAGSLSHLLLKSEVIEKAVSTDLGHVMIDLSSMLHNESSKRTTEDRTFYKQGSELMAFKFCSPKSL